jgi:hypothetical protein
MIRLRAAILVCAILATFQSAGCFNPAGDSVGPNGIKCHTENKGFLFTAHVETTCTDANGKVINLAPGTTNPSPAATNAP